MKEEADCETWHWSDSQQLVLMVGGRRSPLRDMATEWFTVRGVCDGEEALTVRNMTKIAQSCLSHSQT